jgi:hypothetical protein
MLIGPIGEFEYGEGDFSRGSEALVEDSGADGLKPAVPLSSMRECTSDPGPVQAMADAV